jgi:hypothetical protein
MAPIVGFDFDECLAQAYTIVPFVLLLNRLLPKSFKGPDVSSTTKVLLEKSREIFYERVAENEIKTKGTLFRPSLLKLLPKLIKLRHQGNISNLFIYSNNGMRDIIEVVDHILARTLMKMPHNVKKESLLNEASGLHVMYPRVYIDDQCRSIEPKEANGFREKSFEGVQACLGMNISSDDVWFLDDSRMHDKLMNSLNERYVVVKPYNVKLPNKKLADILIESFPTDAFNPGTKEGALFLSQLQLLLPGFTTTGRESSKALSEKLSKALNTFSPLGGGRLTGTWKDAETIADTQYLEISLRRVLEINKTVQPIEPEFTYKAPIGGRRNLTRRPFVSRRRRNRGDRTRRRKE